MALEGLDFPLPDDQSAHREILTRCNQSSNWNSRKIHPLKDSSQKFSADGLLLNSTTDSPSLLRSLFSYVQHITRGSFSQLTGLICKIHRAVKGMDIKPFILDILHLNKEPPTLDNKEKVQQKLQEKCTENITLKISRSRQEEPEKEIEIFDIFNQDMLRTDIFLNGWALTLDQKMLAERSGQSDQPLEETEKKYVVKRLIDHLGETGFQNVSRVANQGIIIEAVMPKVHEKIQPASREAIHFAQNEERMRIDITTDEEKNVKVTITTTSQVFSSQPGTGQKTPEGYVVSKQLIIFPKEEVNTDWQKNEGTEEISTIAPHTQAFAYISNVHETADEAQEEIEKLLL